MRPHSAAPRVLVVGCGALANELVALTRDLTNVDVTCLPAALHNRPGGIPAAVRDRIRRRRAGYETVFVAYADCGTGGLLDRVLAEEGVERLPGAHCYEVFAGRAAFELLTDEEPATFFLTDFLVRNFDRLVWRGLGLDRHPELRDAYFGNYHRVVYLAQTEDPDLTLRAREAADRLGLSFERRFTGLEQIGEGLHAVLLSGADRKVPDTTRAGTPTAERPLRDASPAKSSVSSSIGSRIGLTATRRDRISRRQVSISPATAVNRGNRPIAAAGRR